MRLEEWRFVPESFVFLAFMELLNGRSYSLHAPSTRQTEGIYAGQRDRPGTQGRGGGADARWRLKPLLAHSIAFRF